MARPRARLPRARTGWVRLACVYAFLIAGCICALTQCLSNLKVSFPLVAILLMVLGGGLCTKLGFFDWLNALSAAA